MVRDPRAITFGGWVFIRADALPADRVGGTPMTRQSTARPMTDPKRLATLAAGLSGLLLVSCGSSGGPTGSASGDPGTTVGAEARTRTPESAATAKYRFAVPPSVVFVSGQDSGQVYVLVRMDRLLPRTKRGIRASFELDGGSAPSGVPATVSLRPPCYEAYVEAINNPKAPPSIVSPKDGETVTVTLHFPGRRDVESVAVAARAVSQNSVGTDKRDASYLRKLGCKVKLPPAASHGA
jgi:hypothetical protein